MRFSYFTCQGSSDLEIECQRGAELRASRCRCGQVLAQLGLAFRWVCVACLLAAALHMLLAASHIGSFEKPGRVSGNEFFRGGCRSGCCADRRRVCIGYDVQVLRGRFAAV